MWDIVLDWLGSRHWEPHGHCFLWTPSLLWTIVVSNLLIGVAYYSIPLALLTLVRRRQDLIHRNVFVLFAIFIFGCGTTHLVKLWTIWQPVYWLQGWTDAITAAASVVTAVVLWPLLPRVLQMPSTAQLVEANEALAAANRRLQAALDDRQRMAEALQAQNAQLAQSNQDLERFAYVASHDLKAPLRAIDNLADWIAKDEAGALSPSSSTYLAKLRGRVRRMEQLVEDLLAYSRAPRRLHLPSAVDTGDLVRDAAETLAPPPGFAVVADPALPVLETERIPLETILRNLVGNAIKHHHQPAAGRVTVTARPRPDLPASGSAESASAESASTEAASTEAAGAGGNGAEVGAEGGAGAPAPGQWYEFAVADNGPGIEPQYHQRIFEIFQTLQPRDQVEGSGMGLPIVKRLVESRGGAIWVESAPGEGATFTFTWYGRDLAS
jgi:signal transduction histidine kinase